MCFAVHHSVNQPIKRAHHRRSSDFDRGVQKFVNEPNFVKANADDDLRTDDCTYQLIDDWNISDCNTRNTDACSADNTMAKLAFFGSDLLSFVVVI